MKISVEGWCGTLENNCGGKERQSSLEAGGGRKLGLRNNGNRENQKSLIVRNKEETEGMT